MTYQWNQANIFSLQIFVPSAILFEMLSIARVREWPRQIDSTRTYRGIPCGDKQSLWNQ